MEEELANAYNQMMKGRERAKRNYEKRKSEILAKMKGLLTDVKRQEFNEENPIVFFPVYSQEELDKMREQMKDPRNRIIE